MDIRREEFGEEVAVCELVFRGPNGVERPVRLRVGRPYEDEGGLWACPVEVAGVFPRGADIRGVDSMQAMNLALSHAWKRVHHFVELGGTVLDRDGHAYTADELRMRQGSYDAPTPNTG